MMGISAVPYPKSCLESRRQAQEAGFTEGKFPTAIKIVVIETESTGLDPAAERVVRRSLSLTCPPVGHGG